MKFRAALLIVSLVMLPALLPAQTGAKQAGAKAVPNKAEMQVGKTPQPANPEFEKIKTLLGDWESKTPDGKVHPVTFRLVSAGSAVLVTMGDETGGDMITVIHPDGAALMATHYCSAKNQPRFVAVPSADPNKVVFKFKDVTNLSSPKAGHMTGATFTNVDSNHHTETWVWTEGGKEQTETFQLTRRK